MLRSALSGVRQHLGPVAMRVSLVLLICGVLGLAGDARPGHVEAGKKQKHAGTFVNNGVLVGPSGAVGAMNPYPSTIRVAGMKGRIKDVNVTLSEIRHGWPDDLQVLLVGPGGESTLLMSGTGGGSSTVLQGVTLHLDDQASRLLPDDARLQSGTFAPTSFAAPALPLGPPTGAGTGIVSLSAFDGTNANGEWQLFVADTGNAGYDGDIAGGWKLTIKTGGKKKR
ncbi:MAG: hypothetical protein U0031_21875 [Thermomicrobiales bacterium]